MPPTEGAARRRVRTLLEQGGWWSVQQIADQTGLTVDTIRPALNVLLVRERLIRSKKQGRFSLYTWDAPVDRSNPAKRRTPAFPASTAQCKLKRRPYRSQSYHF